MNNKWLQLAQLLAPIILSTIKPELAPIAGDISQGIQTAEQMVGAKGIQKLAYVQDLAAKTADAVNVAKGKVVVDPAGLNVAVEQGVNTTVAVLNLLHKQVVAGQ
jgi:hypothetical protein